MGFVDGDAAGCYFIDEGLSGISGMKGRADISQPDDMTTSDGSFEPYATLDNGNFYMADGDNPSANKELGSK